LARGPMENYSDRKRGSDIGLYSSTVAQQMTPYAKPMENGNHEDTSWLGLKGTGMPTFMAQSNGAPLQFSAQPYRDEEMEIPEYTVDLPPSSATVLCLDSKTLGVGSAGCGPRPRAPYLVHSKAETFSYTLRLLPTTTGSLVEKARVLPPLDRPWPVLVSRDKTGLVYLDANGDKVEYSLDGSNWSAYNAAFRNDSSGLLQVRSTSKSGQQFVSAVPLDAYVNRTGWKATASSFEPGEGDPEHVIDGNNDTIWHTRYSPTKAAAPHSLMVDMGSTRDISAVTVTPRPDGSNGRARDYELYLSEDGQDFGTPVLKGRLPNEGTTQILRLPKSQNTRFIKFVIKNDYSDGNFGSVSELSVLLSN
ncbi:hypothetical protein EON80_10370, partial [bacterium]